MSAESAKGSGNVVPLRSAAQAVGRYSPSQRAAIIIAVLGENAARPIIEKLDDAALARVASSLENVSLLAKDELTEIVIDFLTQLRNSSGALLGGKAEVRELVSMVSLSRQSTLPDLGEFSAGGMSAADDDHPSDTLFEQEDVWSRLAKRPSDQIGAYLTRLTPNLISLVMRKLDVTKSSEVMAHIDEDKLEPVMGYLVEADTPDPGIEAIVGRMVEMEFLNIRQESAGQQQEYLQSVGEILSLIPAARRENLMKFLKGKHEDKLDSIQRSLFTIEGLPEMLPRNSVPIVIREMEQSDTVKLLSTMQGEQAKAAEFILANISSRMADQIRDELNEAKKLPPDEADAVQREFLTLLMSMKRRGAIEVMQAHKQGTE